MRKFVVIAHNANTAPVTILPVREHEQTHQVVEAYQRELAKRGKPTGVTHQTVEGTIIDALIASHRLA